MRNTIFSILLSSAILVAVLNAGCSRSNEEAIATYKQFMDYWIIQDYINALPMTTGEAEAVVKPRTFIVSESWGQTIQIPSGGVGNVEESSLKILKESKTNENTISLKMIYSASISTEGKTPNPMSPKSWSHYNQTAILKNVNNTWRVARFSGEGCE